MPDKVKYIAHRGYSGAECENTLQAFKLACESGFYGAECDVHVTSDGKYVVFHDDETGRMCFENVAVEKSDYSKLRSLEFRRGAQYKIPDLREYLTCLKQGGIVAVIELKTPMRAQNINEIIEICRQYYSLDKIIFISFCFENLIEVKKVLPEQKIQLLTCAVTEELADKLRDLNFGIDADRIILNENTAAILRERKIPINCWTCDDRAEADRLVSLGAEYITTNVLR